MSHDDLINVMVHIIIRYYFTALDVPINVLVHIIINNYTILLIAVYRLCHSATQ